MGKPIKQKKYVQTQQQLSKKSKKKAQISRSRLNQSQDDQVQDVMAWGRKKQNYYRDDQQQYSSLSEQQKQAKKLYENQYDNYMNDQDLYDIPITKKQQQQNNNQLKHKQQQISEDISQQQEQQSLPSQYVQKQLQWILQLFNDLQYYEQNQLIPIYLNLLRSYLISIISIKELKIPYIQYHPIINIAVKIKMKIVKLMKKLTVKEDHSDENGQLESYQGKDLSENQEDERNVLEYDEDQDDQEDDSLDLLNDKDYPVKSCNNSTKQQSNQHKKGLQYYNQIKKIQQQQKKQKKIQKKQQRQLAKKPAFKQIKQNQSRFASELILKNKGLIKKRKKIQGNSRVKLRKKFEKKKAIHRAKTGHFVRENPGRAYQGQSNIKTGKIAGVKLK